MKQQIDYYCKGCAAEITIFGIMGKNTVVFCNNCKIEMYEAAIKKKRSGDSLK